MKRASEIPSAPNYADLQNSIDKLIGKLGLNNAITVLDLVANTKPVEVREDLKYRLVAAFIQNNAERVFELDEGEFGRNTTREHRECRMAGFHLLKKYTDASFARIAKDHDLHKRQALYACQRCVERLEAPDFYRVFCEKYQILESAVITFISNLHK